MALAITTERTLVTHDQFDDFLKGKDSALAPVELKGLQEFLTLGCTTTCHYGPVIGGQVYQKIGLVNPFPTDDEGRLSRSPRTRTINSSSRCRCCETSPSPACFAGRRDRLLEDAVRKMAWHQLGKEISEEQVSRRSPTGPRRNRASE